MTKKQRRLMYAEMSIIDLAQFAEACAHEAFTVAKELKARTRYYPGDLPDVLPLLRKAHGTILDLRVYLEKRARSCEAYRLKDNAQTLEILTRDRG